MIRSPRTPRRGRRGGGAASTNDVDRAGRSLPRVCRRPALPGVRPLRGSADAVGREDTPEAGSSTGRSSVHCWQCARPARPGTVGCVPDCSNCPPNLACAVTPFAEGWSDDELGPAGPGGRARPGCGAAPTSTALSRPAPPPAPAPVQATVAGLRRPAVVSHQSAAVLHGLPLWDVPARPCARHASAAGLDRHRARAPLPCRAAARRRGGRGRRPAGHRRRADVAGPGPVPSARGWRS